MENKNMILLILTYLELDDLARCELVCHRWHYFINQDSIQTRKIFSKFTYNSLQQFKWHTKKIQQLQIKDLIFYEEEFKVDKNDIIFTISQLVLESLTIKLNQLNIFDQLLINQKQLRKLEILMPITNKEFQLLTQLPHLEEIHLRVQKKTDENLKVSQLRNLRAISLQLQGIQYQEVLQLIQNCYKTLTELEIDADEYNHDQMLQIVDCLNKDKIQKLYIYYFNDYSNEIILKLSQFNKLNKLSIFKAQDIDQDYMYQLFYNKQFQEINLNQCDGITNKVLYQIAQNCQQLKYINLSWNFHISDQCVSLILENSKQLEEVYLIGCKQLTFDCIPQNLNGLFQKLRMLNFESCNNMNDDKLMKLKNQFKYIKIINYYGDEIDKF
ncbi:unnamed protein product [Paramecium pentaurelia]|uniref:F-box domain-containing protein n=1 Tax=Paramecium pentaurelia TaxID=43138 RepID=A0A8S1VBU4_9CILI|nr:unnamed protein product [Paramecium pentaurelia]